MSAKGKLLTEKYCTILNDILSLKSSTVLEDFNDMLQFQAIHTAISSIEPARNSEFDRVSSVEEANKYFRSDYVTDTGEEVAPNGELLHLNDSCVVLLNGFLKKVDSDLKSAVN